MISYSGHLPLGFPTQGIPAAGRTGLPLRWPAHPPACVLEEEGSLILALWVSYLVKGKSSSLLGRKAVMVQTKCETNQALSKH